MKTHSPNFLLVTLLGLILISCAAQPRFCPEPSEQNKVKVIREKEDQKTDEAQTVYSEKRS
ncbi:MAG: hypothetical protein ABII96_11405, partial [Candidatus Zixiibacteriota bacterium]